MLHKLVFLCKRKRVSLLYLLLFTANLAHAQVPTASTDSKMYRGNAGTLQQVVPIDTIVGAKQWHH